MTLEKFPSDQEISRISTQGGNTKISNAVIKLTRTAIIDFLGEIIRGCVTFMEHFRRLTITLDDVLLTESFLRRKNCDLLCGLAGFDSNENGLLAFTAESTNNYYLLDDTYDDHKIESGSENGSSCNSDSDCHDSSDDDDDTLSTDSDISHNDEEDMLQSFDFGDKECIEVVTNMKRFPHTTDISNEIICISTTSTNNDTEAIINEEEISSFSISVRSFVTLIGMYQQNHRIQFRFTASAFNALHEFVEDQCRLSFQTICPGNSSDRYLIQ